MKMMKKACCVLLTAWLSAMFVAGCGSETKPAAKQSVEKTQQNSKNEKQAQEKKKQAAEAARKDQANCFKYTVTSLKHKYDKAMPYNGIYVSCIVENVSKEKQELHFNRFALKKEGRNVVKPEKPLKGFNGIANNPDKPDFSEEKSSKILYPGDKVLVKMEFWEQNALIKSLEGWALYYEYDRQGNMRKIANFKD